MSAEQQVHVGELEAVVRDLHAAIDRKEFDHLLRLVTEDVQGIDQAMRRWNRSREELHDAVRRVGPFLHDMKTTVTDVRESVWGDTGVVTCWLEREYTSQGTPQHESATNMVVLRRIDGDWRITLMHLVPLAERTAESPRAGTVPSLALLARSFRSRFRGLLTTRSDRRRGSHSTRRPTPESTIGRRS